MKKLMIDFEKLVNLRTAAMVAVWLGYRDTRAPLQWITRKKIPRARVEAVKELLKRELKC